MSADPWIIQCVSWSEIELNAVTQQLSWAPWMDELTGLVVRVHPLNIWVCLFYLNWHEEKSSDMLRMFKWVNRPTVNILILFHITKHCPL